jgi:hypothetical protein
MENHPYVFPQTGPETHQLLTRQEKYKQTN